MDDLTALGQKMQEPRKRKALTQQELSDLSHEPVCITYGLAALMQSFT